MCIQDTHIAFFHCRTWRCLMRWSRCHRLFTFPRNTQYFKHLAKLNPIFGVNWKNKHYIKRRLCSQASCNHWYSLLSYLGVSLWAVVTQSSAEHLCPVTLYWPPKWTRPSSERSNVIWGKSGPSSVWRTEKLAQGGGAYDGNTYVLRCPTFFLRWLWWNFFCLSALRCNSPGSRGQIFVG